MTFRDRLLATLRAVQPILDTEGVLVAGSEIPNLLQDQAASTLVVSQDVDLAISVDSHAVVKSKLEGLRGLQPSPEEPSVWLPDDPETMIEVNFIGRDERIETADETYVLDDPELPLMVFGPLSLLKFGSVLKVEGTRIPLPKPSGLLLEKLVTDRTAEKGDRDLLVVLGLLLVCDDAAIEEAVGSYRRLPADLQHAVRSNITLLSLLKARDGMPDPTQHRDRVAVLLHRLERETLND